jgi:hypothetical protein
VLKPWRAAYTARDSEDVTTSVRTA